MELIRNQILGGTTEDRQGEKLTYEFLNDFCSSFSGKRMPINQQHDLALKTIGYAECLRLERIEGLENEWHLIGDLFIDRENLATAIGGFSISGLETIKQEQNPDFSLYIPFPYYNDTELLESLSKAKKISLGKWIKKNDGSDHWAIFVAMIICVLSPAWNDFYNSVLAPRIRNFISHELPKLKKKGIGLQYIQPVNYRDFEVEIRFIGERGREDECYSSSILANSIEMVKLELDNAFSSSDPVCRVVLCYDKQSKSYFIHRIEHESGNTVHYA